MPRSSLPVSILDTAVPAWSRGERLGRAAAAGVAQAMPDAGSNHSIDSYFRWCLRVVETGVEASDGGECSGEPRDLCESLEPPIVRIKLETTEIRGENETQIEYC